MADPARFLYTAGDFVDDVSWSSESLSRFDAALRSGWSEKMSAGMFRYRLGELETRIIPGPRGFVAQLNIQRGVERRKPQQIHSVRQNFDPNQFNFNKVEAREVLFDLQRARESPDAACRVIINVSPLEFGHCLLVPEPTSDLQQVLTPGAVRAGLEAVLLSSHPGFRVGFNSLGGYASVNHLHLHGYYLNHPLAIQTCPAQPLLPRLHLLSHAPPAFLFFTRAQELDATVRAVCGVTELLAEQGVAHNLFITRGTDPAQPDLKGVRLLLWPRLSCFGAKEESAFNVALCELAGHLPFKSRAEFQTLSEGGVTRIMEEQALPPERFRLLLRDVLRRL